MTERALSNWGDALRAAKTRRRSQRRRAAIIGVGTACIAVTIVLPPRPLLVWNASASGPLGLYAVTAPDNLRTGDMVVAWLPQSARRMGAERNYIPLNVPLVKRIAAEPGDTVCAQAAAILINGRRVAVRKTADRAGRAMPWWDGCITLRRGALFLLMDNPASFDGRYFGPTAASDVVGKAHLLWRR